MIASPTRLRVPFLRPLALLLLLAVSATAQNAKTLEARILELTVDRIAEGVSKDDLRPTLRASRAALGKQSGLVRSEAAALVGEGRQLVRATVWKSIEAAEAASLAADGSAHRKAELKQVDARRRSVAHFRCLRSKTYGKGPSDHLEVVVFRTRPGVTREKNLKSFDAAEAGFSKGAGLVGHSLWIAPDGRWIHLLRWRKAADYERTGKALMRNPGVGGWIRTLDFKRFTVLRGDVLDRE